MQINMWSSIQRILMYLMRCGCCVWCWKVDANISSHFKPRGAFHKHPLWKSPVSFSLDSFPFKLFVIKYLNIHCYQLQGTILIPAASNITFVYNFYISLWFLVRNDEGCEKWLFSDQENIWTPPFGSSRKITKE